MHRMTSVDYANGVKYWTANCAFNPRFAALSLLADRGEDRSYGVADMLRDAAEALLDIEPAGTA